MKYMCSLILLCLSTFALGDETPIRSMFDTIPYLQKFKTPAKTQKISSESFDSWKKSAGQKTSLTSWMKYNPGPWRNYFSEDSAECAKKWYISLGPLGLLTLMHDRTWGVFKGNQQIFPKFLCDQNELIFNNYEVLKVKPGSPAEGHLKPGDFIVAIDNQPLKAAQQTYLGIDMDNKEKRGLEIHTGQLLDAAEGRGFVYVTYLRLPGEKQSEYTNLLNNKRTWQKLTEMKPEKTISTDLPDCELVKINVGRGTSLNQVWLSSESGMKHYIDSSRKKGSDAGTALEIPPGKWILNLSFSKFSDKKISILTSQKVPFPDQFRPYMKTVKITLPKIGSFGKEFNPQSKKSLNYARMLAHRLAIQQEEDGSWKAKSYASPSFYTSICGLALLSTENQEYDRHIKKAAHYVAYGPNQDKWTYSNGMWVLFLSEYYLKTRDESILPGLKKILERCRLFVLNDYTAGHSMGKAGYGGSGYIGGGGMLALGFAAASYTPAMDKDLKILLDRMLKRIQEISPHGKVPYGRGGKKLETTPEPGQGGSCGTGPYFLASLIRGGTKHFTSTAGKRYSTAPFGSAENGHATQTLHFIWSMLSSANCSDEAYKASMGAYLWKFTTLREFDGFINQNNYRTEYHNGDGVIGAPYWRTAGYLLILNAWKRNLAVTGNPKFRKTDFKETAVMFHRDVAAQNYFKRNWALAANVLGSNAPESFKNAYAKLKGFQPKRTLGSQLNQFLKTDVKNVMTDLVKSKNFSSEITNEQLCELLLGFGFHSYCVPTATVPDDGVVNNKEEKKELKAESKRVGKLLSSGKNIKLEHVLIIKPTSVLEIVHGLEESIDLEISDLKIVVSDKSGKYLKKSVSHTFKTYSGKNSNKKSSPESLKVIVKDLPVQANEIFEIDISYEIMGQKIHYKTTIECPEQISRSYYPHLTKVKVTGKLATDYIGQSSIKVVLNNGDLVGCETRFKPQDFIPAGAPVEFEISPDNVWAHVVRSAKPLNPIYRSVPLNAVSGCTRNEIENLIYGKSAGLKIGAEKTTLEFQTAPSEIGSIFSSFSDKKDFREYNIFLKVDGHWQMALNSQNDGWQFLMKQKADGIKLVFEPGKEVTLKRLLFHTPATHINSDGFW